MGLQTNKKTNIFLLTLFILLTAILHCFVHYAQDDFYYLTFLDNGLSGFVDAMVNHHLTVTGRSFVHIVLCPLLRLNMIPFRIFNVCLIGALLFLVARLCCTDKKSVISSWVFGFALFFLLGIPVLSDGVLWGAGSLNYLFPAFLVCLYLFLYRETISKNRTPWWLCLVAFLCGATVEMSGALAVVVAVYLCFVKPAYTKGHPVFCGANILSAAFGWGTIFMTSGIHTRLTGSVYAEGLLLPSIMSNFSVFCRKICSVNGLGLVLLLVVLLSLFYYGRQKQFRLCLLGGTAALCLVFVMLGVWYHILLIMMTGLLNFVYICIIAFERCRAGDSLVLLFVLCIAASLGACLISPVVGDRMLLPTGIYLLVLAVRFFNLNHFQGVFSGICFYGVVLTAMAISSFYIFQYEKNDEVIRANNRATAEQSQNMVLRLSHVYDEEFGAWTVPTDTNFGHSYIQHYGLAAKTIETVHLIEGKIYYGETLLAGKALWKHNVWYVPVRTAAAVCGAQVSYEMAHAVVKTETENYRFAQGANAVDLGAGFFKSQKLRHRVRVIHNQTYIALEDFNHIFQTELRVE